MRSGSLRLFRRIASTTFQCLGEKGSQQAAASVIAGGEACLEPVAERHQFIDLGDDAVLFVAVDGAHQLVVATEVTANASDQGGVPALLDALAETVGEQPETVLADAGYSNERDLADLETRGIDGYVSLGREGKAARPRDPEKYPATSRMAEKLSRPAGRAAYAERKWLSEAPNGWIKHVLGFRRFSLRGLAKVQGEWDLVCLALNTKRLHALLAA